MGGKLKGKTVVSVALPNWEADFIENEAKRLHTTISAVIKAIIEDFIQRNAPVLKSGFVEENRG